MLKLFMAAAALLLAASSAPSRPLPAPPVFFLHWTQFPVHVYIFAPGRAQQEEVLTVLAGFDEWTVAAQGKISYVRVADTRKAEITVHLEAGRYLSAALQSVGETTVYSAKGVLKKAGMRLAEGAMTTDDLQATAAHEFGHALGIQGHSEDQDDLMFPIEILHFNALDPSLLGAAHTVTAHDLQLLKQCYPDLSRGTRRRL